MVRTMPAWVNRFSVFAFCVTNSHIIGTQIWAWEIKRYLHQIELKRIHYHARTKSSRKQPGPREIYLTPRPGFAVLDPGLLGAAIGQAPFGSRLSALLGSARLVPARLGSLWLGLTRLGSVGPGLA